MLSEKEITSLIRMLDDPDEKIAGNIVDQLIKSGKTVLSAIDRIWEFSLNPLVDERVARIKQAVIENEAINYLTTWKTSSPQNVVDAWLFLSELLEPIFNKDHTLDFINRLRFDAWMEMNDNQTTLEKCTILIHVFEKIHHLKIISNDTQRKSIHFLPSNLVVNSEASRTCTAMLFQHIAKLLDFELIGLNYFEYAILGYFNPDCDRQKTTREDVLFYIIFGEKITVIANQQLDLGLGIKDASLYTPATANQILHKILFGLKLELHKEKQDWQESLCDVMIKTILA
jgi:hypothetical protein